MYVYIYIYICICVYVYVYNTYIYWDYKGNLGLTIILKDNTDI